MSTIDLFFLIVFLAAAFFGATKGAVRQIGSLAGVVGGWMGARAWGDRVGEALGALTTAQAEAGVDPQMRLRMAHILGCVVTFIAIFILIFIVARMLRSFITWAGLSPLDRVAGAAISVIKWFIALSIALNLWLYISPGSDLVSTSTLASGRVMAITLNLFPWLMGIAGFN